MFVPKMTLQEVMKEFKMDFPMVMNKKEYYLNKLTHDYKKHGKGQLVTRFFDYKSIHGNDWIIMVQFKKKASMWVVLACYYSQIGLVGITQMDSGTIVYHTSHFFKRYNERLCLNLRTPKEILHKFMFDSEGYQVKGIGEISPGVHHMMSMIETGYSLGIYDLNLNFLKMNTFITNEMLYEDQMPVVERLKVIAEKYKDSMSNLY